MKKQMKKLLHGFEWLHFFLLLTPLITAIYVITIENKEMIQLLYWQSAIIAIAIVGSDCLERFCKWFVAYLGAGIAMLLGITFLAGVVGRFTLEGNLLILFQALIFMEVVVFLVLHYHDRMAEIKQPHAPHISLNSVFAGYYIIGLLFDSKVLCDIAFYSCLLYVVMTAIYAFFSNTEHYIQLNHAVKNVPIKRLFGIGGAMLASILLFFLLLMIPVLFSSQLRRYTNVREWEVERPLEQDFAIEGEIMAESRGMSDMELIQMLDDGEEKKMSPLLEFLLYAILGGGMIWFVIVVVKEIFQKLTLFQNNYKENEDIIETLDDSEEKIELGIRRKRGPFSEKELIRKQYRKMIRKYRKDRPYAYETPTEMEAAAGILEKEEMKRLHVLYEAARYDKEEKHV